MLGSNFSGEKQYEAFFCGRVREKAKQHEVGVGDKNGMMKQKYSFSYMNIYI